MRAHVLLIAGIAALGGLLFGYDTGIISAALLFIGESFPISVVGKQIVTAAIVAGALVGCMGAGPLSDRIGRRPTVMVAAIVFMIASVASTVAGSVASLTAARLVLGLAVGAASQIIPVYIAELAPAARRGAMVVMFQLAVVGGILVSTIVGWLLGGSHVADGLLGEGGDWRLMFLLGVVPAAILLIGMIVLPESPRYLALKGDLARARAILARLRPSAAEVEAELAAIGETVHVEGRWRTLLSGRMRPALIAGAGVAMFSQITGTNAVIYYAPTIATNAGLGQNAALLTALVVGVTIVLTTIFGTWAVDHWGRRRLMLRFLPGAVIGLAMIAIAFAHGAPTGAMRWVAAAGLLGYEVFNVGSISAAIWLVGAEVFPLSVRGKGMSLVALSHWSFDLLVTLTTLSLVEGLGTAATFWLFAGMNLLAWGFVWRFVPETKGRSLEEIEASLQNGTFASAR